jgi:hypothetical protein
MGGYMRGYCGHRSFYMIYPEVDTFHNDYHSDLTNLL